MIIIFIPWISVGEKEEKYFKMTSAELAQRVVKVTNHFFQIYVLYDYHIYSMDFCQAYFLGKIRKIFQNVDAELVVKVNNHLFYHLQM